ncbi:MAG TPA: hypothetical protein VMA33_01385 [Candidatus Tectomicrobia bacterium]|nr:hypothetical protein [Candidatus Tectomicrobia bacterium]
MSVTAAVEMVSTDSNPSDITACIDPSKHPAERPTKALRIPWTVAFGMDRRGDPASIKSEIDLEFSTGGNLALP